MDQRFASKVRRALRGLRHRLRRRPRARVVSKAPPPEGSVCVVAILKGEDRFVEEWVAYHRLLGIDHFYLYDNDPRLPLRRLLAAHADYVTVIDWLVEHDDRRFEGRTKQLKAYLHFLDRHGARWQWVAFIDGDEFIALEAHDGIKAFLRDFADVDAIALNWHVFGHNGYYDDPPGLIIEHLTRRMRKPREIIKLILRTRAITFMDTPHRCRLMPGSRRVDANKRPFSDALYEGKTDVARINHYQCRSFLNWMSKPERGEVGALPSDAANAWRFSEEGCLREFVTRIALDKNEYVDTSMLRHVDAVKQYLGSRARP